MKTLKMEKDIGLPKDFKKLEVLEVCSNKIIGGGNIFGIDNFAPLLIGDGEYPRVWLYSRIDKVNWTPIIKDNESLHSDLRIYENSEERRVTIIMGVLPILSVVKIGNRHCKVDQMDLRPIGYNLYGNNDRLVVSNSNFTGNVAKGISFMIGFTDK